MYYFQGQHVVEANHSVEWKKLFFRQTGYNVFSNLILYIPILRFTVSYFLLDNSATSFFSIIGVQKMAFVIENVCKSMNSALTIYAEKTIHLPSIYILSLANISEKP